MAGDYVGITRRLWAAVKTSGERQYRLARKIGLHPSALSDVLCGVRPVRRGDRRIIRLGALLGVGPDECFGDEPFYAPEEDADAAGTQSGDTA